MNWINKPYLYTKTLDFVYKPKIAAFDIDGTIITTKSGCVFPKNAEDWKFLYLTDTVSKLKECHNDNYCIIFISNQAGLKSEEQVNNWKIKMEHVIKKIGIPISIYASIEKDIYRKPLPTIWNEIKSNLHSAVDMAIDMTLSFYCGDAAGRKSDHNDTDYKFALNNQLIFMTPEMFFQGKSSSDISISYIDFESIPTNINYTFIPPSKKELIILIGYPGSGKSFYFQKYISAFDYIRINQDTLKTKKKCMSELEKHLKSGKNLVIDNQNYTREIRSIYIASAKENGYIIRGVVMNTSFKQSKHNMIYRYIKSGGALPQIPELVYNKYKKNYENPMLDEGIDLIEYFEHEKPYDKEYEMYLY